MNSLTYKLIDDRIEFIRQIDLFIKDRIAPMTNGNVSKVLEDSLIYILKHINYRKKLISETNVNNRAELAECHEKEIEKLSNECNWPEQIEKYEKK